jgi:dTDP-4-dehydrorhamnose reductase
VKIRRSLITGGGGQLASDLADRLAARSDVTALPRARLDITDDAQMNAAFEAARPDVVFNCAAFHNVERCEREEDRAFATNARAVKRLAAHCERTKAKLVHVSTNYVFDGAREEPYAEGDAPNPRSIYALSKLAGEYAALAYAPGAVVVRSAGLYGCHGSASKGGNFVSRMLARASEKGRLKMVDDQRLNPTFTADLADAIVEAVEHDVTGLLHLTNSDDCSWHEFTVEILRLAGMNVPVEPIATTRQPAGAHRPRNGMLARPGADAAGIRRLRPWRPALADYMKRSGSFSGPLARAAHP